jgi:hypothetical protein
MRKEFNKLVEVMQKFDIYQLDDEVGIALNDLSDKITEVEKRIICAIRSAEEANDSISKYTEDVDKSQPIFMSVDDHDSILRGTLDVCIGLDLEDYEPIENNWYSLFSPTEEPTKKESAFEFESSCGTIECDIDGRVLRVNGDLEISGRRNWLFDIIKFDIEEYSKYCSKHNITHGESLDIFTVGYWKINDEYIMADDFFRDNAIGAKTELSRKEILIKYINSHRDNAIGAKTELSKEKLVNDIISQLKAIDVDGDMMEYILKQVGMEAQMLRQLFVKTTNDDIDELIDERILYNRYSNHLV